MTEKIIKIIVDRDKISEMEARKLIDETADEILSNSPDEAAEILMDYLGVEPDYLEDVICG